MALQSLAHEQFYIVGIGASAGGLEALESFFSNCPVNTGISFVIVQHLSPDYKSMMPSLLARRTKMPIKITAHGEKILPDHIYLIPGDRNLIINNGKLELQGRAESHQLNLPIDLFFDSLAKEQKEKAIGVILSGTGSDGTRGGKAIKEAGGTLFVQDPETIRFDGMPLSAIENGLADYIMAVSEIPEELINFIRFPNARDNWEMKNIINDTETINKILLILRNQTNYDFLPYRRQTLTRRIIKRLKINKLENLKEYIDLLENDPIEQQTIVNEFLIGVTKFFRDQSIFKVLEKRVIPEIVKNSFKQRQDIKAWSVGCSSGEEAYSLAILFQEAIEKLEMPVAYKVFATDIDGHAIDAGSKGIYKTDIINDIPPQILAKYFINKKKGYQIKAEIRKNIIFSKHDILQNPPFNKMDLISCRNMLIYFSNKAQKKALASLHFALKKHGYLFLGSSESLGSIQQSFNQINRKAKIYKNIDVSSRVFRDKEDLKMYTFSPKVNLKVTSIKEKFGFFIGQDLAEAVDAVCVFINDKFDIIHAKGNLNKYFTLPTDGFSNNIMTVFPSHLNIPISTGIRLVNSGKHKEKYIIKQIQHKVDKEYINLQIRISKLPSTMQITTFLISIIEVSKTIFKLENQDGKNFNANTLSYEQEIKELQQALTDAKENLQLSVEELEITNEEIQATNEELIASNEELQSTNEELQSVNEELHTVNAELQEKNIELLELNSDMENLIHSTNIGTIFLDKEFRIRKFTPAISEQLELRTADIGRLVSDFSWANSNLEQDARKVLSNLQPLRKEIQNKAGVWYLEQILPYRTQDDMIKGVLVNYVNIDSLKQAIKEKEKLDKFVHEINEITAIIFILDIKKPLFEYISKAAESVLGYSVNVLLKMKKTYLQKLFYSEDLAKMPDHLMTIKNLANNESENIECRLITANNEIVWVGIILKVFERDSKGQPIKVIGICQDITKRKNNQLALKESNEKLERFAYISSHDLKEPLNTIISALDLMKLEIGEHEASDLIQPIEDSTARMKVLIENLLDYSILNKKAPQLQFVQLNQLLEELRQDLSAMLLQKNVSLEIEDLPTIEADKTFMKQLFQNLVDNAVKYNDKPNPIIKISVAEKPQQWLFSVTDNGIGIEEKYFNSIFDVFKKLHAREKYAGAGIGLANCKTIVQAHQGNIWLESTIKNGSTFHFTISKHISF